MRAIMETVFDILYLLTVITLGVRMIRRAKGDKQSLLFGVMAVVLGAGDAFHLVPRMYALNTLGLDHFPMALGIGKLITSISMTVFYVLLYHVWQTRYAAHGTRGMTIAVYALAALRIFLCLLPQNQWTSAEAPLSYAILRNTPFAALGILTIALYFRSARATTDKAFGWMWLTIVLSFLFYIPVVLFADLIPALGLLMIPKTLAYVWTVMMGYRDSQARLFKLRGGTQD